MSEENRTIVVRHFPPSYTKDERIQFMKTYNAIEVKCLISKYKKRSLLFAKFKTRREAEAVVRHLHQAKLEDDHYLSVEFARESDQSKCIQDLNDGKESCAENKDDQTTQNLLLENFISRLHSWSQHLDLRHPPPHHLNYHYPPPNASVITNIARALASVPKFYTQVLHLMNKMCLPCPFTDNYRITSDLVPDLLPGLFPGIGGETSWNSLEKVNLSEGSLEESEIESDTETSVAKVKTIGEKRPLNSKSKPKVKRLRLVKPPSGSKTEKTGPSMKPEEAFELPQNPRTNLKKIEVKVTSDLKIAAGTTSEKVELAAEGFEKIEPMEKVETVEKDKEADQKPDLEDTNEKFISEKELAMNRISIRDQQILPVFKNYLPGLSSCRLYIKNLAKNVELTDLRYIYKRYFVEQKEEQGTMFDIRLMQEGRMKGQAFITLQNERQADIALKETNGFILKGKPMVVQFARAKPVSRSD